MRRKATLFYICGEITTKLQNKQITQLKGLQREFKTKLLSPLTEAAVADILHRYWAGLVRYIAIIGDIIGDIAVVAQGLEGDVGIGQ